MCGNGRTEGAGVPMTRCYLCTRSTPAGRIGEASVCVDCAAELFADLIQEAEKEDRERMRTPKPDYG